MTDLRTVKTRARLEANFLQLLQEKPLNKITVAELTRRSQVGRGTFYLHYEDIYDLYNQIVAHLIKELLDDIDQSYSSHCAGRAAYRELSHRLVQFVVAHHDQLALLLQQSESRHPNLIGKIQAAFTQRVLAVEHLANNDPVLYTATIFNVAGVMGIFEQWLRGKIKLNNQQLISVMEDVVTATNDGMHHIDLPTVYHRAGLK